MDVKQEVRNRIEPLLETARQQGYAEGVRDTLEHLSGSKPKSKEVNSRRKSEVKKKAPAKRIAKRPLVCNVIADLVNERETVNKDQVLKVASGINKEITKHDVANALGYMVKQGVIASRDPGVYARVSTGNGVAA